MYYLLHFRRGISAGGCDDESETRPVPRSRAPNHISSVTSKGQATIPADIHREAGIEAGDKVLFSFEDGRIVIEKSQAIDDVWNAGQSAMFGEWNDPDEDVYAASRQSRIADDDREDRALVSFCRLPERRKPCKITAVPRSAPR